MRFELKTPEERFRYIHNKLKYAAELRAQLKSSERNEQLQELYKGVVVAIDKLAECQRATAEKLHALIETADRTIAERGTSPS